MLTHGGIYNYVTETIKSGGRMKDLRFLACHPIYHTSAIICLMQGTITGATIIFTNDQDPAHILNLIEEEKIQCVMALPVFIPIFWRNGKPARLIYPLSYTL